MPRRSGTLVPTKSSPDAYDAVLAEITRILEAGRRAAARSVNAVMTATYWEIGRRIIEIEQGGEKRAGYGEQVLERLSHDLTRRFGRGFGVVNAELQRRLTCLSGQAQDPVRPIDTLPLPVCTCTRAPRDQCFPGEADYGYCDAKDLHYYGSKPGLRISRCGMIIHFLLLAARPDDINHLEVLGAGFRGIVPADKGFI
ncbi:MAG TPA: DUF1016 N-terminal domain-containing protein, partial [Blastocatellia bacterium]|nr:DUF1016 N-terminal domain-containing protein [Blastocatellia bacterium]